jgi:MerR family transcriptional regulator, light-induced transcriptional regulator
MTDLDLTRYSTAPLFNTKAVVQSTGISAATLRAWERRYGVPEPERTDSNYRLYSERDIALIRWLKERVESGVSISQAVELYRRALDGQGLPSHTTSHLAPPALPDHVHDTGSAIARLIAAFKAFDERAADQVMNEVFSIYPIEDVLLSVIQPTMIEVGEQWHRGEVSVPMEHFATAYMERKLMGLFNAQPLNADGPLVIAGCAPREQHELGILLFAFFLRRYGVRVLYLGANVPMVDLRAALESLRPAMLALSALVPESVEELQAIAQMIREMPAPRPLFAIGGGAFRDHPELAEGIHGMYLGHDARQAAHEAVRQLKMQN